MASDDHTIDEKLPYLLEEDDNYYCDNNHDNDESPNLISRMDNADTFNDDDTDNDNDDDETNNRPRLMAVRQQHQRQRQQQRRRRRRQQQEATTTTTVTEGSKPFHLIRRKENDDTTQSSGSEDEEDADDEDSDDDENEDEDSEDDDNDDDDDDDSDNDDDEVIAIPEREGGREVTTYDYIDIISDDTSSEDDSDRDDRGHRINRRVPVVNGGTMENRGDNNNEDEGDDDDDTPPRLVSRSHRQRVRRVQIIIAGVVDVPIVVPVPDVGVGRLRLLTRQLQGLVHGPRQHILEQQQQQSLLQGPAASFDLELCHRCLNRSTSTTIGTHAASAKRQALSPAPLLAIMPRISSIVPVDIPAQDIPLVMSQASQFLDPQDMIALLQVETLLWCSMRKSEAESEAKQQGSSWHFPQLRHRFCRIHGTKLDLTYEDSAERRRVLLFTTVLDPQKEQTQDAPALAPRDRSIHYHDNNNKNNNHKNDTDIETDNIQFLLWCLEQQAFITAAIAASNEVAEKKKEKQLCPSSSSTTSLSWPSPSASASTNTTTSTTTTTTPTSTTTAATLNTNIVYLYPDCFHCRRGVDESGLEHKDIELVMSQIGPQCTRAMSVQALRDNDHDLVNAIMSLTHI